MHDLAAERPALAGLLRSGAGTLPQGTPTLKLRLRALPPGTTSRHGGKVQKKMNAPAVISTPSAGAIIAVIDHAPACCHHRLIDHVHHSNGTCACASQSRAARRLHNISVIVIHLTPVVCISCVITITSAMHFTRLRSHRACRHVLPSCTVHTGVCCHVSGSARSLSHNGNTISTSAHAVTIWVRPVIVMRLCIRVLAVTFLGPPGHCHAITYPPSLLRLRQVITVSGSARSLSSSRSRPWVRPVIVTSTQARGSARVPRPTTSRATTTSTASTTRRGVQDPAGPPLWLKYTQWRLGSGCRRQSKLHCPTRPNPFEILPRSEPRPAPRSLGLALALRRRRETAKNPGTALGCPPFRGIPSECRPKSALTS